MSAFRPAVKIGSQFQNPIATEVGGPGLILKLLPLYLSNKEERVPRIPLGPFRTDANTYAQAPISGLRITWFGHSSLLIEMDGCRLLVDPVWDERASPVSWAGPKRFFAPALPLTGLPPLDAILISHDHYDHLGKHTVKMLSQSKVKWVTSIGVGHELRRFDVPPANIIELDWTDRAEVNGITITALPARHFSGRTLRSRFETLWSSFALRGSQHNLYFGADSGLWDGFADIGRDYGPFDLTMLEIGAYNDLWKAIHMGPDGAIEAFTAMGKQGLLAPIHWGLFDLALHAWYQPIERIFHLADAHEIQLWSPEPGTPTEVVSKEAHRSEWWKSYLTTLDG